MKMEMKEYENEHEHENESKSKRDMMLKWKILKLKYLVAALGGVTVHNLLLDDKKVNLSWTTNYTPTVSWDWNWDKRDPLSVNKPSKRKNVDSNNNNNNLADNTPQTLRSRATRHLIFIRHGQYNIEGSADEERILTKLGREQAALTGERLKDLDLPYSRLVFSSMTRATETAQIIMEKLGKVETVEKCDMLREGAPIPPEPAIGNWKAEMHKFYADGARIEAAFRKYFHRAPYSQAENSYEIFVCHANVIRYFICRSLQLPPEAWLRMSLHNGSITYITIRPDGRVGLKQLGDCGYMPKDKLTVT